MAAIHFVLAVLQDRHDSDPDEGAAAVEYGLLVGLIAVVIIVAVGLLGGRLNVLFQEIVTALGG